MASASFSIIDGETSPLPWEETTEGGSDEYA
jgi:hypothetical protein